MADRSRRIGSILGYALASILGVAGGFALVQVVAGGEDETPTVTAGPTTIETTSSTTGSSTTLPVEEIALELADVETVEDATALIEKAPQPPQPLSITVGTDGGVPEPVASTAFLVASPELTQLDPPFLRAPDGSPARLPGGDKLVVMVALPAPIADPSGLVAAVVFEQAAAPAFAQGPFAGTTSAVAARLRLPDVIGSFVDDAGSFVENAPAGSIRVDGPLLTFVVDPIAPFRVVLARGYDSSLNTFGLNPPNPAPALAPDQLTRIGDVEAFVTELNRS